MPDRKKFEWLTKYDVDFGDITQRPYETQPELTKAGPRQRDAQD